MANKFPLILNTSANQIQEIASGDNLDLTGSGIHNAGVITATSFSGSVVGSGNVVSGIITATKIDLNGDIDVDGHTNLDNVSIAGVSTLTGDVSIGSSMLFGNNKKAIFGDNTGGYLEVYNSGSDSIIKSNTDDLWIYGHDNIFLAGATSNHKYLRTVDGGTVALYFNNNQKLETTNTGITVTGGVTATTGTFSGNVSIGGTLTYEDVTNIDSVGIVTARAGINATGGNITLGDSGGSSDDRIKLGASGDLEIYHSGSDSFIHENTKTLILKTTAANKGTYIQSNDTVWITTPAAGEIMAKFIKDGAVELNFNDTKRIETTNTGAVVTGICTATSFKLADGSSVGGVESDAQYNTVGGTNAGDAFSGTSANANTLYGYDAGTDITSGDYNTAIGSGACENITTGHSNVAIGPSALRYGTVNYENVIIGREAAEKLGYQQSGSSGSNNVAIGRDSLKEATSTVESVFVGSGAGKQVTTGSYNVGLGQGAHLGAYNNCTGSYNTGVGHQVNYRLTSGASNVSLGAFAGNNLTSGSNNILIGDHAGDTATNDLTTGSNNILIGHDAQATSGSVSNEITLGDANITKFRIPGIGLELTGTVGISTEQVTPSSGTATINLAKDDHKIVASGTYTINCTGTGTEANAHTIRVENTGISTVGFSTYFKFPSGGTPSLPTASGAISLISFTVHKTGAVGIATVLLAGASVNFS